MDLSALSKDPTKLPCPRCSGTVDAGATWKSIRNLRAATLTCPHCNTPLAKETKNHWSSLALIATLAVTNFLPLTAPWNWLLTMGGLVLTFGLIAKEIDSTHLTIRDDS